MLPRATKLQGKWWSNNKNKAKKLDEVAAICYLRHAIFLQFTLIFPETGWDFWGRKECSRRDSVPSAQTRDRTPSHRHEQSPPIAHRWGGQVTWWAGWSLPRRWWAERWQTACRKPVSGSSPGSHRDDHWWLLWYISIVLYIQYICHSHNIIIALSCDTH